MVPTARTVATLARVVRHPIAMRIGRAPAGGFQIAFYFALEKIGYPARDMRFLTGDAEQALIASAALDPYRAALLLAMRDAVFDAAQRNHGAVREGRRFGQPAEPRRDPAAVLLREFARLLQAAARRHGCLL